MVSIKISGKLTYLLALLLCLTGPFVSMVTASNIENDFITIFGEALNTHQGTSTNETDNHTEKSSVESVIPENNKIEENSTILPNTPVNSLKVNQWNQRGGKRPVTINTLQKIAHSTNGLLLIAIILFLFLFTNLSLAAFSFKSTRDDLKHYHLIESQVIKHKWLTLLAGVLNGGVVTLITLILLNKLPLIGLIVLAWVIRVVLQVLASKVLMTSTHPAPSYRSILELTLCQLSIYVIPVYGQLELLKTIIRGAGAKVLIKTGFGNQQDGIDKKEDGVDRKEDGVHKKEDGVDKDKAPASD